MSEATVHDNPQARNGILAWRLIAWPAFAVLVLVSYWLGFVGFRTYLGAGRSTTDVAYLALQLFTLESGSVPQTGTPWQLEIARILAPATTAIAVGAALVAIFRSEIVELRLRLTRNHVVVCGLGNLGSRLVDALHNDGHRVVIVEQDGTKPVIEEMGNRRILVVTGDARHLDTLGHAGVDRAKAIMALTSSDDANTEIAIRAGELTASRKGAALTCFARITDPDLSTLLTAEELSTRHDTGYRLEYINIEARGARALLTSHPPSTRETPAHVVVVGLNPLGRALVVEAGRQWRLRSPDSRAQLNLTVVDESATRFCSRLQARYPSFDDSVHLLPIDQSVDDYALTGPIDGACDAVYICTADGTAGLDAALSLDRRLPPDDIPIVADLTESPGLTELVDRLASSRRVRAFDLFAAGLRPDLLFGGTHEILARAIHQEYLEENLASGATLGASPSLQPWDALPESLRESNRDQAAHIGVKVAEIGCRVIPVTGWEEDRFRLTDSEVERLAVMEHDRWTEQRLRDGWTPGPKDVERKHSPYLVPWTELDEEIKEWDRRAVRGMTGFLARAGYRMCRVAPGEDRHRSISITPG